MLNIDLDDEFLNLFYNLTSDKVPQSVNLIELKRQLIKVVDTMKELSTNVKKAEITKKFSNNTDDEEPSGPAILVVDDLGVITYQLKVLLSQFKYDVDCSQEIYDAVNKFKKRQYSFVIMDLFIPTEREGFILLTELKKLTAQSGEKCVIGIITASPRKEIELQCKARGADFFLEKSNDWQNSLANVMSEYINADKSEDDF